MSIRFLLVLILNTLISTTALGADVPAYALPVLPKAETELSNLSVSLENAEICSAGGNSIASQQLQFEVVLHNRSAYKKSDLIFPLNVMARDEFGNGYQAQGVSSVPDAEISDGYEISLYPGEKVGYPCWMQVPVPAAREILLEISDKNGRPIQQVVLKIQDIKNWNFSDAGEALSEDDLIIVYPRDRKVFAPGEKVFVKLGFSDRAGKPNSIYVLFFDYMLEDEEGKGQYELQIPSESEGSDFEVIVMAEWGEPPHSQIVSKSLVLQIKG